jgi:ABC-2 type transport system permease protein
MTALPPSDLGVQEPRGAPGSGPGGGGGLRSVTTVFGVLVRALATRGRVVALGSLGVLGIVLSLAVRTVHNGSLQRADVAYNIIDGFGLSVLVPVVALVFASAVLGDPSEDGTLIYLWLRPLPRWQLALSAFAAALAVTIPMTVVPLVLSAIATGVGIKLVEGAAAGGALAAVAYSAVFCGLGLRVRRALAWGLAYLLIWEQAVARVSHGAARASVFVASRSVTANIAGHEAPLNAVAPLTGVLFPLIVAAIAVALTARSLNRGEIA